MFKGLLAATSVSFVLSGVAIIFWTMVRQMQQNGTVGNGASKWKWTENEN